MKNTMKVAFVIFSFFAAMGTASAQTTVHYAVEVVNFFETIRIKIVNLFEDETWKVVGVCTNRPNLRVQIVDLFEDRRIKIVNLFEDKRVCITNPRNLNEDTLRKLKLID